MAWHDSLPYIIFTLTFLTSIFSGIAGGGGGFIITPFLIAIGLTPQQSIATSKLGALGLDAGSWIAFKDKVKANRKFALTLTIIALAAGIISSQLIRHLENDNLQLAMGWLNLAMIPFIFIKHHKLKQRRRHSLLRYSSFAVIIVVLLLQGVFSSGIGSLVNIVLITLFGYSALEANFIKRRVSTVLDTVILAGLLGSGLINIKFGIISAAGCFLGGYIGSSIALRSGEKFARYALAVFMLISGVWLITSAS